MKVFRLKKHCTLINYETNMCNAHKGNPKSDNNIKLYKISQI